LPETDHVPAPHSRHAYREGQEDQPGALGLVLNAVVRWNAASPTTPSSPCAPPATTPVGEEDARLSMLGHADINVLVCRASAHHVDPNSVCHAPQDGR
jgi:hypothetical protein